MGETARRNTVEDGMWIALGFVGFLVLLAMMAIGTYNGLVTKRNHYKNAYAQIDVQLKRRYDLIPNLVEAVKGAMTHERETLEAVIKARNAAYGASQTAAQHPGEAGAMSALSGAEAVLSQSLGRLLALHEAYPDIKANLQMRELSEELSATENKVAFARQAFNDAVMAFNNTRDQFPAVVFANMLGMSSAAFLESTESAEERKAPKVKFS